jgi:hypothetical protein
MKPMAAVSFGYSWMPMQSFEPASNPQRMRNLYLTALAELDDDQLVELVAGASGAFTQESNPLQAGNEGGTNHIAFIEAAQTARMLCLVLEGRMQGGKSLAGDSRPRLAGVRA